MYFQPKVDYYCNEFNKNKYKNFQLIIFAKNNLRIAEEQIVQGITLAATTCYTFLLGIQISLLFGLVDAWKYVLSASCLFEPDKSLSILYQHDICNQEPALSFITLVPIFIFYYTQMWGYHTCMDSLQPDLEQTKFIEK